MPMGLLHDLERIGGLRVVKGPVALAGYRLWSLRPPTCLTADRLPGHGFSIST